MPLDVVQRARLPVEVRPGMFRRERVVSFDAGDRRYSLFIDERDVLDGNAIEVSIVSINPHDGLALIDLPSDTLTTGNRVFVPRSRLHMEPRGQRDMSELATPAYLTALIGDELELFEHGHRCERQGMGIGAFAYYRLMLVNQREHLMSEAVAGETAHPSLTAYGENLATLLYECLAQGTQSGNDEECLELASSIRIVLTELAERISVASRDETELNRAVANLQQFSVVKDSATL